MQEMWAADLSPSEMGPGWKSGDAEKSLCPWKTPNIIETARGLWNGKWAFGEPVLSKGSPSTPALTSFPVTQGDISSRLCLQAALPPPLLVQEDG